MKSFNYFGDGKYVMMEKGDTQFYKHRKGGEKKSAKIAKYARKHVCASTILDIHQENTIKTIFFFKKLLSNGKVAVTLHRQKDKQSGYNKIQRYYH